jgi:TolB-like protein/Tfp pilus assembly protein PilF
MFTDIVGYTALMGSDEDRAFDMLARNHTIHETLIKKHNGTLIKEIGDGTLASFPLASNAVRCAMDIQKEAKSQKIPLKIGIHEGEMVFAGSDVLGDGVNVASRLEELSQEGSITISGTVQKDIKNKAGINIKFIGDKKLKNVDDPVKVYEVLCEDEVVEGKSAKDQVIGKSRSRLPYYIIAGMVVVIVAILIWYFLPKQPIAEMEKSIAVLPFETITKDSTSQYIAAGVREAILNNLQKIEDLEVGSRTSSETYRNSNKRIPEIASELGVATILEGSAQKFGNQIRITVQLIDGITDNHIWSEDYDRAWGDIFAIYTEIAEEVATALQAVITPEEKQQIASTPTTDVTAYDYILQAREEQWKYWGGADTIALKRAEMLYDKVLELDPKYAPGWKAMGSIYYDRHYYTEEYFEKNFLDSVLWYCDKAISFDSEYGGAYHLKGMVFHKRGNIELAVKNYEKAVDLIQNDPFTLQETLWRLGYVYIYKKDYINGISLIRKAVQLAKSSPQDYRHLLHRLGYAYLHIRAFEEAKDYFINSRDLSGWCIPLCWFYVYQGNFHASIDCASACCQADSSNYHCNYLLANNYLQLKEFEASMKYFRKFRKRMEDLGRIQWDNLYREGFALIQLGFQKEGTELIEKQLAVLDKRKKLGRSDGYDYHYAAIYAYRGDLERALQYIRDYEKKIFFSDILINPIIYIQHDIMFENLWENEEFKAIIQRQEEKFAEIRAEIDQMEEEGEL